MVELLSSISECCISIDMVGIVHFFFEHHSMPNILQITIKIFYTTNAYNLKWSCEFEMEFRKVVVIISLSSGIQNWNCVSSLGFSLFPFFLGAILCFFFPDCCKS